MLRHVSRSAALRSCTTQQASAWQILVAEGAAAAAATMGLAFPWASQHCWASSAAAAPQTAGADQSVGPAAAPIRPEGSASSAAVQLHSPQVAAQLQGGPRQTAAGSAELDSPMQYRKSGRLQGPWKEIRRPIFAVVEIGGSQCKVTPGDLVFIEKIHADVTDELAFDRILLLGTREESVMGRPYIPGASVRAVVEEQFLNGKVLIFKKRRRKNSRRLNGHRQPMTALRILDITGI